MAHSKTLSKVIAYVSVIAGLAFSVTAQAEQKIDPEAAKNSVKAMVELPINKVRAVQDADGNIFLMAGEGNSVRFVIKGSVHDVWHNEKLTSIADFKNTVDKIDTNKAKIDFETINAIKVGSGDQKVTIFVDPRCPHCHIVMEEAKDLLDEYEFNFVFVPVLDNPQNPGESTRQSLMVACMNDDEKAFDLSVKKDLKNQKLDTSCKEGRSSHQRTLIVSQMLGVSGVPFIIAPNGTTLKGRPANFTSWLSKHKK